MRRRLVTPFSILYCKCLNSVSSHDSFLFNQPPQGWKSSRVGDKNDEYLRNYIARSTLIHDLGINIPWLWQAAENSYTSNQQTKLYETIYTAETFKDYHTLLCALLSAYENSLERLKSSSESKKENVERIRFFGHIFHRMINGSTIEYHLQNINSLLWDHRRGKNVQKDKDTNMDEDVQLMDEDADLETNVTAPDDGSEAPIQLWKLYGNWLRLMVAQFSAAETLAIYVQSEKFLNVFNDIAVKIVVLPFVPVKALPLTTLLERRNLFPDSMDQPNRPGMPSAPTNVDLLEFIDLVQPLMGMLVELQSFVDAINGAKTVKISLKGVSKAIAALDTWPNRLPRLPKWQGYGEELKEHFQVLKSNKQLATDSPRFEKITKRLAELKKSAQIFALMKQTMTPEMAETAGHCEAYLASLLVLSPGDFGGKYNEVIREFQVNFFIFSSPLGCDLCFDFKGYQPRHWSLATFLPNMLCLD
jgi:hypothetical protein